MIGHSRYNGICIHTVLLIVFDTRQIALEFGRMAFVTYFLLAILESL